MARARWVHGLTRDGGPAIHFVEHGSGEPVLLLHGFPDFWYMWRHQIPLLAGAGYRAVAVDLRGFNRSDAPGQISAYRADEVALDIVRVMDTIGLRKAALVGHDWGGIVAWHFAMNHPGRISSLVVINAPHPAAYLSALLSSSQLMRSWYVIAFQLPRLPEIILGARGRKLLKNIWWSAARGAAHVTEADIGRYVKAYAGRGKLRAALNYYRAGLRGIFGRSAHRRIGCPTLLLWGMQDKFLVSALPDLTRPHVANLAVRKFDDLGHWPHLEKPALVSDAIIGFLARETSPRN